jgi:hypothetical protein
VKLSVSGEALACAVPVITESIASAIRAAR